MSISETACLTGAIQHNSAVRLRPDVCLYLATSLLAGCAAPTQRSGHAPIWEDLNTVVSPSPVFPLAGPVESNAPPATKSPPPRFSLAPPANQGWIAMQRWAQSSGEASLVRLGTVPAPTYGLRTTRGTLVFRTGSQVSHWDGTEMLLGFAPQLIDGQPYMHSLDLYKTVQPLLAGEVALPTEGPAPVIVIDPGHGGENAGTSSVLGNHFEKEFTLDWAQRIQAVLLANNCKAFLTRSNDTDLALSNRVAFAAQHKADLFVSLHFNSAAPNDFEAGLETYCLTPVGMPSSLTRGYPDELRQPFPNNAFDLQNLALALRVHRALLQVNGHHDRGIRRARFPGVLRGQERAAILVEGGYLSNPQEARLISEAWYRQKLAEAVAKALLPPALGTVALSSQPPAQEAKPVAAAVSEAATNEQPSEGQLEGRSQSP